MSDGVLWRKIKQKRIRECCVLGVQSLNKMVRDDLPENVLFVSSCGHLGEEHSRHREHGLSCWPKLRTHLTRPTLELCFPKGTILKMLVRHS